MAVVRLFKTEGVDDERVDIVQVFVLAIVDTLHIGYVGEASAPGQIPASELKNILDQI